MEMLTDLAVTGLKLSFSLHHYILNRPKKVGEIKLFIKRVSCCSCTQTATAPGSQNVSKVPLKKTRKTSKSADY